MIEVALLASTVVRILVPYLKKGAEAFKEEVEQRAGQNAGGFAVDTVAKLWQRVRSAVSSTDDKSVVDQFERRPEAAKTLLEDVLKEQLAKDEELAAALHELLQERAPASGQDVVQILDSTGVVVVHGDVHGGNVIGYIGEVHGDPGYIGGMHGDPSTRDRPPREG